MTEALDELNAFHADRKAGIGSTDSAAILGLSPWKSAHDVWRQKVMGEEPKEPSLPMWLGLKLEDAIAELYTAATSQAVYKDGIQYVLAPRQIMRAHVDYRWTGMPEPAPIVECKTSRTKRGWGEPMTDQVPKHYWIQVQHQMAVANVPFVDVAVLFGHDDFRVYRVYRDDDFINSLVTDMEEWWDLYVATQTPPPLDGSEGATRTLRERYPSSTADAIPATSEQSALVRELFTVREAAAALARSDALLVQKLKDAIGEHAGMHGPDFNITWKDRSGFKKVDWQAVIDSLAVWIKEQGHDPQPIIHMLLAANTEIKGGSRPFVVEFIEGAGND